MTDAAKTAAPARQATEDNVQPVAATSVYSLAQAIDRYSNRLSDLESAAPKPSFEQIVVVLVAARSHNLGRLESFMQIVNGSLPYK